MTTLSYFGPDRSQGTVMKRIQSFLDQGWDVTGYTFKRQRQAGQFDPFWNNVDLGEIANGRYLRRLIQLAGAALKAAQPAKGLKSADIIYARNLDLALIALTARALSGSKALVCYEVNDIRGLFVGRGWRSKLARWLERRVLKRADWLVTSSPWFQSEYFEKRQGFRGPTFVLENRIYDAGDGAIATARAALSAPDRLGAGPLTIGWFGVLDCTQTWDALKAVSAKYGDQVHIYMRGFPEYIDEEFYRLVAERPNLEYGGKFNNRVELPAMYERVDVVCGFDFKEPGANSTWLMPNSFYESGAFCRPLLAYEGTATAQSVLTLNGGWALRLPLTPALDAFVEGFDRADWRAKVDSLAATPLSLYAGQDQFLQLVSILAAQVQDRTAAGRP
jgi:succinoglycan biosynthesis protein ExoL